MGNKHSRKKAGYFSLAQDPESMYRRMNSPQATPKQVEKGLKAIGLENTNVVYAIDFGSLTGESENTTSENTHKRTYSSIVENVEKSLFILDSNPKYICTGSSQGKPSKSRAPSCTSDKTTLASVIRKSCNMIKNLREYHILVIVANEKLSVENLEETVNAIVYASIVLVDTGYEGQYDLHCLEDELPPRRFENFNYIYFMDTAGNWDASRSQAKFFLNAMADIPRQFKCLKNLGYLSPLYDYRTIPLNPSSSAILPRKKRSSISTASTCTISTLGDYDF